MIDIRHLRCFDRFVSALVIENDEAFLAYHFVFIEELLCPGETSFRVDNLNVDLSFASILILREQVLQVAEDRIAGTEKFSDPHLSLHALEKTLRFVGERVLLVARKIPAFVMLEAEIVDHGRQK